MTERPPLRPTALALLISLVASGLLCVGAVAAAPGHLRAPLAWCSAAAAVLLSAAVAAAVYGATSARVLRARVDRLSEEAAQFGARSAELTRRCESTVTELTADFEARTAELTARCDAKVVELTVELKEKTAELTARAARAESVRSAAMSAAANAAGRMQALATGMLADLREMEHRHTDEDVLGDLLLLDHRTAQAGRLADSIAVLAGARSGRRWAKPIVMESILRGAMGRIAGYQRIRLHSTSEVAIAGHAAEGVMHCLAELLDNAANFSPPTAEVHVYVEEVPAGVILTIEDSGLVMSDVQLRRAERAVTSETTRQTDLAGLSGTRLGLAVVGRLARKHGLTVSFRPSARGGTGVLVLLPQELITRPPLARDTGTRTDAGTLPAPATEPEPEPAHATPELGESGLPQRRRGRTLAAAHPTGAIPGGEPRPRTTTSKASTTSAARFSTFRQAVRGDSPDPEGSTS
ncbi:ATP-binding protein [Streptomyces sp. NPDC051320]|uniref:ATP-binding protein n=1 Tax=Streptomyces sp. NPDC051320 TaxID=3154644 RepID=UPI0034222694